MAKSSVKTFTASGKAVVDQSVRPTGQATIGTKLEDGRVIPKPRPRTDRQLLSSGPGVRVINPRAIPSGRKFAGLGRDGSVGPSRD